MSSSTCKVGRDHETAKSRVCWKAGWPEGGAAGAGEETGPGQGGLNRASGFESKDIESHWRFGAGRSCDLIFCVLRALWPLGRGQIKEGQRWGRSPAGAAASGGGRLPLEPVHRSTCIVPGTAGRRGQGPIGKEVPGFLLFRMLPQPCPGL